MSSLLLIISLLASSFLFVSLIAVNDEFGCRQEEDCVNDCPLKREIANLDRTMKVLDKEQKLLQISISDKKSKSKDHSVEDKLLEEVRNDIRTVLTQKYLINRRLDRNVVLENLKITNALLKESEVDRQKTIDLYEVLAVQIKEQKKFNKLLEDGRYSVFNLTEIKIKAEKLARIMKEKSKSMSMDQNGSEMSKSTMTGTFKTVSTEKPETRESKAITEEDNTDANAKDYPSSF